MNQKLVSTAPLRGALIGCGTIAYEHARFFERTANANLIAVVDRSEALARALGIRFGAAASYTSTADLYAKSNPQIVHILTPPGSHEYLVREALDAGCHVICEKPMTSSLADTKALLDYAAARNLILVESTNTLWNENVVTVRQLIDSGEIGEVREVEIAISLDLASGPFGDLNLQDDGVKLPAGAVHDFLPHFCALFLALSGQSKADEVSGSIENLSGNRRVQYDFMDCRIRAGQVRGRLRLSPDISPDSFRIQVAGTKASAETELYNPYLRVTGGKYKGKMAPVEQLLSGFRLSKSGVKSLRDKIGGHTTYHSILDMLEAIYSAIGHQRPMPITPGMMCNNAALVDSVVALRR